jgi:hypothetical protein
MTIIYDYNEYNEYNLKCKEGIATEPSKSAKQGWRSHPHIVNYNYKFRGQKISGYNIFCYISVSF